MHSFRSAVNADCIMPKTLENPTSATPNIGIAPSIEQAIQEAVTYAREACDLQGSTSSECAVAWDIVEELQAERSHQRQAKTSLERYCDENPDASECRIYDV